MNKLSWFFKFNLTYWLLMCAFGLSYFVNERSRGDSLLLLYIMESAGYFVIAGFMYWLLRPLLSKPSNKLQYLRYAFILMLTIAIAMGFDISLSALIDYLSNRHEEFTWTWFTYKYSFWTNTAAFGLWLLCFVMIQKIIRSRQIAAENLQLSLKLSQAQLDILKGQINPHFMFNSLNNIRSLILQDTHQAREMITHLSDMLRYSLNANKQEKIAIRDEIEIVEDFIALSKIQLDDRLQLNWQIEPEVMDYLMPPMMLQMLVENAIKHGINQIVGGGVLTIKLSLKAEMIDITVTNPVSHQTVKSDESTFTGCENIRQRLQLLYAQSAHFDLTQDHQCVHASIVLPKEH